jgi:hypothetical protein
MRNASRLMRKNEPEAHHDGAMPMVEALERRELLSCAVPVAADAVRTPVLSTAKVAPLTAGIDGTYTGTVQFNNTGPTTTVTLVLSGGGTVVQGSIPFRKGIVLKANFKTFFIAGPAGIQIATFNTSAGGGSVQIKDGQLSLDASLDVLVGAVSVHVAAVKGASAQNLPVASHPGTDPPITTLALPQAVNPLIGTFAGKLTAPSSANGYSFTTIVATKKGTTKLSFSDTIRLGNFGDLSLSFAVSAHSNGKFSVNLGSTESEGTITGHFSRTGKLVLTINVPGLPAATGSARRV